MKTAENIVNVIGVGLLVVFLVLLAGYPGFAAEHPNGAYTTARGNEVQNTDALTAVIAIIAITVLAYVLRGKSVLLVLLAILALLVWAGMTKCNPPQATGL